MPHTDPTSAYASAVTSGAIVAGRLVRLACERHLRDLESGAARGLHFDTAAAERVFRFFGNLKLAEDRPFILQPFQKFILGSIYGWKKADGYRRFQTAYVEMGKGNGKSPLAGGIGLYGLVADGEQSAEIYAAATKKDQAMIMFKDAVAMVNATPALAACLKKSGTFPSVWNLAYEKRSAFFRPISSENSGQSGPRPHVGLIDELHEHKTGVVVNMMRAGFKSRKQPLIFEITNSGYDRTTTCWHHHEYSEKILTGVEDNDSWFAYVCTLDPCDKCAGEGKTQPSDDCKQCDQWDDESKWMKANPALGSIITADYVRGQVKEAKGIPAKEGDVRRLNFCVWTQSITNAIPMDHWDACAATIAEQELEGRECFAGLDLGATSDFSALVLLFPHDDAEQYELPSADPEQTGPLVSAVRRSYTLLPFFWIPEEPIKRDERMTAQIDAWRRAGLVKTTPGNVADYGIMFDDIVALSNRFVIRKLALDYGFQGCHLGTRLLSQFGEEIICTVRQGILSLNMPFREMLELIKQHRLHHGGHPVMRWMCGNCAAEQKGGLIKPSKDHSREKIDGVTAATEAMDVAMREEVSVSPTITWI